MSLDKITKETYVNDAVYSWKDSPLSKIEEDLREYMTPQGSRVKDFQIPSIPGGRLVMSESSHGDKFYNPKVDLYYLSSKEKKNAPNIMQVRYTIERYGLKLVK